jgi:hypothetical protein
VSDFNISEFGPCDCPIRNHPQGAIVPHWRSLVESKYLSHFELAGRDVTVTIKSITLSEIVGAGGKKSKKALVIFQGKQKGMVMGATCLKTIARIYGDDTDAWIGKPITIYPTTTEASGETVGTIRIRPTAPATRGAASTRAPEHANSAREPERQPGDDGDEDKGDVPDHMRTDTP